MEKIPQDFPISQNSNLASKNHRVGALTRALPCKDDSHCGFSRLVGKAMAIRNRMRISGKILNHPKGKFTFRKKDRRQYPVSVGTTTIFQ
ncbi:hypothetical protein JWG45_06865 [Leptospira sp. 201903070]|uniref:Uncharacterized protein n=1 Tax=Leptospira ainlahdjerensis TaxID=2810033 RepID=A0ABS2U935_9LEPT|nr:hypothetical protein [Leptospira ainlahdjerensis]MBM9576873.1 hypothetical protein [Leptospira ainlahdjerensis]